MKIRDIGLALLVSVCCLASARADVKLPGVFADHMVLQRDNDIPVWGWADAGEDVTVTLAGKSAKAKADADGKWSVKLQPQPAGGPFELTVSGKNSLTVNDVLVGEVWMCSGQSNMAMTVSRAKDFEKEKTLADYPKIRMFKTASKATPEMQADCGGKWMVAGSDTIGGFSATAWFFGRKLHRELKVPIGLINSSWGGTDVAAWTSLEAQKTIDGMAPKMAAWDKQIAEYDDESAAANFEKALERWKKRAAAAKANNEKPPRRPRKPANPAFNQNRPANLFNGMIHPLIPYGIRGAIWYQGERNSKNVADGLMYGRQLKTLISDWRTRWGRGDFPFITVQLPNFHDVQTKPSETTGWVLVREGELKTLQMKNTGIAVTTDVGEAKDIHPKNKQTVGQRLALWALGSTYEKDVVPSGPLYSFHQFREGIRAADGSVSKPGRVNIYFRFIGEGLKTSDDKKLTGFAVADEDGEFHFANAKIVDDSMILVSSRKVFNPVAVRYNWADNPVGNLVNSAGLPASPFRTDKWDVTQKP